MTSGNGWIGSWSPGIGDPTIFGWLTVLAYLVAAWMCLQVVCLEYDLQTEVEQCEKWLWRYLVSGIVLLGINKQLDLQSALTEIGRIIAVDQGWYESRRNVQFWFILAVALIAVLSSVTLIFLARSAPKATLIVLAGCLFLLGFVVMRAASFHHLDGMLRSDIGGVRMNWILEIGSLLVIIVGARLRVRRR
jgi:hypothetical protein